MLLRALLDRLHRSPREALLGSFLLALAVRLVAQIAYGSYTAPQTFEFDAIARAIVTGEGYHYRFFDADWLTFGFPAVPLVLAFLHWIGGGADSYGPLLVAIAAMSASLAPLSYLITRRIYDTTAGLVAALVISLDPVLILFAVRVHELNVDALVLAGVLYVLLEQAAGRRGLDVPLGVLAGLTALVRPTILVFATTALVVLAARVPRRGLLLAAALAVIIAAPWAIRNAIVLGGITATPPYSCVTFWMGNNRNATGGPITADGRSVLWAMDHELRARVVGQSEIHQGEAFCDDARRFLQADPLASVGWWARKLFYFWWFPPHAGMLYAPGLIDVYRPAYAIQLALVIVGIVAVWRAGWRPGLGIIGLELLVISASQSVGYVEGRHRLVLEPSLIGIASIGVVSLLRRPFGGAKVRVASQRQGAAE